LIPRFGGMTETISAWQELSRTLDWTPERTFDELLGRRVSLVMKGLKAEQGPDWALLSEVRGTRNGGCGSGCGQRRAGDRGAVGAVDRGWIVRAGGKSGWEETRRGAGGRVAFAAEERRVAGGVGAGAAGAAEAGAASGAQGKSCDVVVVWRKGGRKGPGH